jgi:phosphoenolpyruvate carboxykinase (ATP)
MKLKFTRSMIRSAMRGELDAVEMHRDPVFGLNSPTVCPGVPSDLLIPRRVWADQAEYERTVNHLADLFVKNFAQFESAATPAMLEGSPARV